MKIPALLLAVLPLLGLQTPPARADVSASLSATERANFNAANQYSLQHAGKALVIAKGTNVVFESYANGVTASTPLPLESGTKSFWCAAYVAGIDDGLFKPDTLVSTKLTAFQGVTGKKDITVREVLSLTSGLGPGIQQLRPRRDDQYTNAMKIPMIFQPGTSFQYGPGNDVVFGAFLTKVLNGETPLQYMRKKVFDPIGMQIGSWNHDNAGHPTMEGGAHLTARNWLKYGELLAADGVWNGHRLLSASGIRDCVTGSKANPMYGLTFWLNGAADPKLDQRRGNPVKPDNVVNGRIAPSAPPDMFLAIGAFNQRLYIIPSLDMTIVRFGTRDRSWHDEAFMKLLFGK